MIRERIQVAGLICLFFACCCSLPQSIHAFSDDKGRTTSIATEKQADPFNAKMDHTTVKAGDIVKVDYTVSLEDGRLIYSTQKEVAQDSSRKRIKEYVEPESFGPEEVIAGKSARLPGIAESIVGMTQGDKKEVRLQPDSAFGPADPKKIQTFPTERKIPIKAKLTPIDFVSRFGVFPFKDKEVQFTPFLKARINEVTEKYATLEMIFKDGQKHDEAYGSVEVRQKGEEIAATLTPIIGASLPGESSEGKIVGTDGKNFTVDFNPPLSGKVVKVDLEVKEILPADKLSEIKVPWLQDHDKGLAAAKGAGKPAVMLLYADWCSWCKKLKDETFADPRIKVLKDKLVFIKVNSDKDKEVYKKYEQKGFPLVLLFDKSGKVVNRIDGYKDAASLREAFDELIASDKAS